MIGIAPDIQIDRLGGNDPPQANIFLPYPFLLTRNHGLMVRVRGGAAASVTSAVREAIRASDPAIPVFNVR